MHQTTAGSNTLSPEPTPGKAIESLLILIKMNGSPVLSDVIVVTAMDSLLLGSTGPILPQEKQLSDCPLSFVTWV